MKARIPKQSVRKSALVLDEISLAHSEEIMKRTWTEFGNALARKDFEYTDTDNALSVTFLRQFDGWFQGIGKSEMTVTLSEFLNSKHIGRGTIIKPSEPQDTPPYDRLLPVSKFITEDNRFSPPAVEWLYLAVGENQNIVQKGAENECRAKQGDRFAFCNFEINTDYSNLKVVDLTIADKMTYDDINKILKELEERENDRAFKYVEKYGYLAYRLNYKNDYMKQDIAKWVLRTYAKMMSKNLFVPINTDNKKLVYAPFQTLAMYFIREGFDGIVYSSTVCPESKNIVLFNKNYAVPCGDVLDYIIAI